ncbi:MAG: flagellin [Thermoplasmatales archaeon]|nr:flagellin [Thermoplasmatales archaeon]
MGKRIKLFKYNSASIGIGALIVFIAIILVAGIAASVLIQTSTHLETRAAATGRETTSEVATGLAVFSIEAYAADSADISKLAILVRPWAGSEKIDLIHTRIELSDATTKIILNYTTTNFSKPNGLDDIFSADVYPDDNYPYHHASNRDGTQYGILVLDDYDNSISATSPVMNRGDKVYLCINTTGALNNIAVNTHIWGQIMPEIGYSAHLDFRTPYTYADNVMEIYLDM